MAPDIDIGSLTGDRAQGDNSKQYAYSTAFYGSPGGTILVIIYDVFVITYYLLFFLLFLTTYLLLLITYLLAVVVVVEDKVVVVDVVEK